MNLTDKELLSFCDLVNLKVEFAENTEKKEKLDDGVNDRIELKYKTIHSLLEKEYKGIEERERQGIKKPSLSLEEAQFGKLDPIKIEEIRREEKAYKKIIAVGEEDALGGFYKSKNINNKKVITDYLYQSKKEMKKLAPVMMELFDRYNEAVKKGSQDNHVGKFLTEWEVIHVADDYLLVKQEFESVYEEQIQMFKEPFKYDRDKDKSNWKPMSDNKKKNIIEKLENAKKEYPTREKVEDGIAKKAFIDGVVKILESPVGGVIPGLPLNKVKFLKPFLKPVFADLSSYDFFQNVAIISTGRDVSEIGAYKVIMETIVLSRSMVDVPIKKGEIEYSRSFDLTGNSLRVGVFKSTKSKNIVFAIAKRRELSQINKILEDGKIPKEISRLSHLIKKVENAYPGYTITFTGTGNAGKIASILELVHSKSDSSSDYSSKGYFYNFPSLLPSIVDLTQKDLEDVNSTLSYLTNQEVIIKGTREIGLASGVLIASVLFTGGASITIGAFLMGLLITGRNVRGSILNKKNYTEYLEFLEKNNIISKLTKNQIDNYESGKISGEVIADMESIFEYKGIKCDFSAFLQLSAYEMLFRYKINESTITEKEITLNKGNVKIKISLLKNSIKRIEKMETYKSEALGYSVTNSVKLSEEDSFGDIFYEVLKQFQLIQKNYKDREGEQGYYFKKKIPEKIERLGYTVKEEKTDYAYENISAYYFPFVNEKGVIVKTLQDNYIASVIRSIFENDKGKKYYEETLEEDDDKVEEALYTKAWSTVKHAIKSDEIDKLLMRKVKELITKGKVMHKEKLLDHLEPKEKIRDYYEVTEESETRGYLTLGIFDDNLKYKTEEFGYVYHDDHLEGRVIEEKLVLYGKKEDLIKVTTTGVSSSAILRCDNGSTPSELKVTSQIGVTTNGLLDATEGDKAPFVNILPFGKCNLNRDGKGQPLPCEQFISPSKWSGVSRGSIINGMKELISTSKVACKCGGEITILAAISSEIKN